MQATLITLVKENGNVTGDLAVILTAAIGLEEQSTPSYGVIIECDDGRTFECQNGRIDVSTSGDDGEDGTVMMVDGVLMISWSQGARTVFFDTGLMPA